MFYTFSLCRLYLYWRHSTDWLFYYICNDFSLPSLHIWIFGFLSASVTASNFSFLPFCFCLFVCISCLTCRFLKVRGWLRNGRASSLGENHHVPHALTESEKVKDDPNLKERQRDGRLEHISIFPNLCQKWQQLIGSVALPLQNSAMWSSNAKNPSKF